MEGSLWPLNSPPEIQLPAADACPTRTKASYHAAVTADISLVAKPQESSADPAQAQDSSHPSTDSTFKKNNSNLRLRPAKQVAATQEEASSLATSSSTPAGPRNATKRSHYLLRKYLAVQAAFALSGSWHAIMWYNNNRNWAPHWFLFFALQAPICMVEGTLAKWCKNRSLKVPRLLGMVLTQTALAWMSSHLFLGPMRSSGLEAKVLVPPIMINSYLAKHVQFCIPYPGGPCLN